MGPTNAAYTLPRYAIAMLLRVMLCYIMHSGRVSDYGPIIVPAPF